MEYFICRVSDINGKVHWDLIEEGNSEPLLFGQEESSHIRMFQSIQLIKNSGFQEEAIVRYRGFDHWYFHVHGPGGQILARSRSYPDQEDMEVSIEKLRDIIPAATIKILSESNGALPDCF